MAPDPSPLCCEGRRRAHPSLPGPGTPDGRKATEVRVLRYSSATTKRTSYLHVSPSGVNWSRSGILRTAAQATASRGPLTTGPTEASLWVAGNKERGVVGTVRDNRSAEGDQLLRCDNDKPWLSTHLRMCLSHQPRPFSSNPDPCMRMRIRMQAGSLAIAKPAVAELSTRTQNLFIPQSVMYTVVVSII